MLGDRSGLGDQNCAVDPTIIQHSTANSFIV